MYNKPASYVNCPWLNREGLRYCVLISGVVMVLGETYLMFYFILFNEVILGVKNENHWFSLLNRQQIIDVCDDSGCQQLAIVNIASVLT